MGGDSSRCFGRAAGLARADPDSGPGIAVLSSRWHRQRPRTGSCVSGVEGRDGWTIVCANPQSPGLRADARILWANEPRGLEATWRKFAGGSKASPKLWMDAYLAAFALAGGYRLVTTDKAFKQFNGLDLLVLSKS